MTTRSGTPGLPPRTGPPRIFDHDQARAMHADGATYQQIADTLGVSKAAVNLACDPAQKARAQARSAQALRDARKPCLGGCGCLVWTHGKKRTGLCTKCLAYHRAAEGVRDGELLCRTCDQWKPDEDFSPSRRETRRGRRPVCRACETDARRRNRQKNPEAYRAYDNTRKREGLPMTEFIVLHNADSNGTWEVHSTVEAVSKMAAIESAASTAGRYVAITAAQIMDVQQVTKLAIVKRAPTP